ncbi:MAG: phosphoglucosamine mutase, partial [Gammaproteobacteria bacterium]|nr:phosphoglucosamine mutase [Gammaproteobacteria bacterium]NNM13848.1 phosphoglucosamine mutase [Gammaproteobacteria bacterium]
KVGNAVGLSLLNSTGSVVIGRDTRISGGVIEAAISAGLQAAGVNVQLAGIMPTPGVAFLTRKYKANLGIVISASHNPYYDNGIKFFNADGGKLSAEQEQLIEQAIENAIVTNQDDKIGQSHAIFSAQRDYMDFVKDSVPRLNLDDMKIVLDAGHGATYRIAPMVFEELRAHITMIGDTPNGCNINNKCGSTHTKPLENAVKSNEAQVGFAFDGDGDRLVVVDEKYETVDGDEILFILANHAHQQDPLTSPVVGTSMTNMGLEVAFRELGIEFMRARVGDKHVLRLMHEHQGRFGGETSGHLICLDHATTGDGLIAALQLVAVMQSTGKSINELKQGFKKYPQVIVNININDKKQAVDHFKTQSVMRESQKQLGSNGRIVLRPSGTEPVVRVMVEGENPGLVTKLAHEIGDTLKGLSL